MTHKLLVMRRYRGLAVKRPHCAICLNGRAASSGYNALNGHTEGADTIP